MTEPTIDDQIHALEPLGLRQIGVLMGYAALGHQVSIYRNRGSRLPAKRLLMLAEGLERLAEVARGMAEASGRNRR